MIGITDGHLVPIAAIIAIFQSAQLSLVARSRSMNQKLEGARGMIADLWHIFGKTGDKMEFSVENRPNAQL
jgi:hypothetical protein